MINIFILDDDETRHAALIKRATELADAEETEVRIALDAEEAKNMLIKKNYWDIIMLDHDLGNRVFVDSSEENTGFQVAKFIRENNIRFGRCLLHSMNPVGVKNMLEELEGLGDVYRSPFFLMI